MHNVEIFAAALTLVVTAPLPAASIPATTVSANDRLMQMLAQSEADSVARNPLEGLFRGDDRHDGRFGDYLSDSYFDGERKAALRDLEQLKTIDRAALPPQSQIAYDAFAWQRRDDLDGLQPAFVRILRVQPLEQVKGLHILMPRISAGGSVVPFREAADYDANARRLREYAGYLHAARMRLAQGLAQHLTEPRAVMVRVAEQLDEVADQDIEDSPFFAPIHAMPDSITPVERERIARDYRVLLRDRLLPAYRQLRDFIRLHYLPKARRQPGLSAVPGGARFYAALVRRFTTTTMTPAEVHALGVAEVARIEREMDNIRQQVGFDGSLTQFADAMRSDPRFAPASSDDLQRRYRAIQQQVEARLPAHFGRLPRARLDVRPLAGASAGTAPNASYAQGPPDGSRPGVFSFNVSDLPSRRTFYMESLFLHEGVPGHHLQDNLAQENEALPGFLRFEGTIAFGEGWALYAESLGTEFGLYRDPYQQYGRYTNEVFRAARLVVDTGIHTLGWSRDRAITYLLTHTALSRTIIEGEVDRYIAYPGQALAYKVGELRIMRLRRQAEAALGARFDERAFHDAVLIDGRIPLDILERKMARWIEDQRP